MHAPVRIAGVFAVKKPDDPIALQAAVADFLSQHEVAAADGVAPVLQVVLQRAEDLVAQLSRDPFVGIDVEDPVVLGAIDGVVLLRRGAQVLALFQADAGKLLTQQLHRAVGGKRIDEIDLVRPFHGADAVLDVFAFVEGGDDGGQGYAHFGEQRAES